MISIIILFLSLAFAVYLYVTRNFNYWKDKGVCYIKPSPLVGNLGPLLTMKYSIGEYLQKIYNEYKNEPYVGIFLMDKPCLVIRDLNLVNRILKQDFQYFSHRAFAMSKKTDPIGARSLFSVHGTEWKNTRSRMASVFAPSKQKIVFDDMTLVGEKLAKKLNEVTSVEIKELSCCFTANIISNALLGIDGKGIEDPDNDSMRILGKKLFADTVSQGIRLNLSFVAPELMELMNLSVFTESTYKIMGDAVKRVSDKKKDEPNPRGDYIDSLLSLRAKGPWPGNNGEIIVPDENNFVANTFMFFTGSFETGSNGMLHCFYEVAKNQEIQEKIREEINYYIAASSDGLDYNALNEMEYLGKFITDCLRKNPPFPFLDRKCSMDYRVPGTNFVIEKGLKILIPMMGFHRDEKYYPEPDSVIPERYDNPEALKDKPNFSFGTGPRSCLGMRFAQQFLKIALISCLTKYKLTVSEKTPKKWSMDPKRFGNCPICKVFIDVHKLNNL